MHIKTFAVLTITVTNPPAEAKKFAPCENFLLYDTLNQECIRKSTSLAGQKYDENGKVWGHVYTAFVPLPKSGNNQSGNIVPCRVQNRGSSRLQGFFS